MTAAEKLFQKLSRQYPTPLEVQKMLRSMPYNKDSQKETCRSALGSWRARRAHCLEAAFIAAAILEHHGYPPLVMSLESVDDLDHVVYVFQEQGKWGAIGRSREEGLHGRAPIFRSLRDLAGSYLVPYVDNTGRIKAFGLADLDHSAAPWRDSVRNVWKAERFLIDLKHKPLRMPEADYRRAISIYNTTGHQRKSFWW